MTSSHSSADISSLDQLTGGAFAAGTSGDRAARLRDWLASGPALEHLQDVYREMSSRDKGAAKVLKERLDELKRVREQDALVAQWAAKGEQLLAGSRLNIADALAWQRDAAKAGAPLSREPLAGLKNRLSEVVRRVEDLQHQVMVQREAAVLLAQRVEVLSTKPLQEAHASRQALQADVQAWVEQAAQLMQDSVWPSVDMKFPPQLEASRNQLQAVWEGFDSALKLADAAVQQADAPLPGVPVWADEIRACAARHRPKCLPPRRLPPAVPNPKWTRPSARHCANRPRRRCWPSWKRLKKKWPKGTAKPARALPRPCAMPSKPTAGIWTRRSTPGCTRP